MMRSLAAIAFGLIVCFAINVARAADKVSPERTGQQILSETKKLYPHSDTRDPAEELRGFVVHPDFEVQLFASTPMVMNPISICWDAQGRLWVTNSPMYPQILPGQKPTDFISVLEDTDGDGKADKSTVFYDKLYMPTGFELGDGGVYVANQPDLLFLKDTNGDLKADVSKVLLSGFGTEDNHHAINAFTWCPGGWLYFESGVFLHTQVETPFGIVRLDDGGVFQLRPRQLRLELFNVGTATNPWGHSFDKWGQSFLTEGPQGDIWFLTPGTVSTHPSERVPGTRAPKSCGTEFLYSSHFSEKYRDMMVLNAFKNKAVHLYTFSDDGAGYSTKEIQPPLIQSREPYFRPVDVKVGPDGAIYIADFFQEVIGHMQYEFRDPRRDHVNGRIWRISQKNRPKLKQPAIVGRPAAEVVELLKSPEGFVRHKARRQLYELDQREVVAALNNFVSKLDPQDPEFEHHRLEALWSHQTVDHVEPALLRKVLESPVPQARAAATRVLRYWLKDIPDALTLLEPRSRDEYARVRLEAICALSFLPGTRSMELVAQAADYPQDKYLNYSFRHTAAALKKHWLPDLISGKTDFGGKASRLQAVLTAIKDPATIAPLLRMLKSGQIAADQVERILGIVAEQGSAAEMAKIIDLRDAIPPALYDARLQSRVLTALNNSAKARRIKPTGDLTGLRKLILDRDPALQREALRLAGVWKVEELRADLDRVAAHADTSLPIRTGAIEGLSDLGGAQSIESLQRLAGADQPAAIRSAAAIGLASLDLPKAAAAIAELMTLPPQETDPALLFGAILLQKGGDRQLELAIASRPIHPEAAKVALQYMNSSGRQQPGLIDPLRKIVGAGSLTAQLQAEDIQKLMAEIRTQGDPHRGELVFRRKDLACTSCHAISGGGPHVGPDLEGLGTSSPLDYLVTSILDPNKAIREGYGAVTITTTRGRTHTGILRVKNDRITQIIDGTQRTHITFENRDIDEITPAPSIMPKGLVDSMSRQQFVDLVRFISELGRPGPFAAKNVPVIRSWRLLVSPPGKAVEDDAQVARTLLRSLESKWIPAYTRVSGDLPLADLRALVGDAGITTGNGNPPQVFYVRGQIDVGTPGKYKFRINAADGLKLWLDETPVVVSTETVLDLKQGPHTLLFRVDAAARAQDTLRVLLEEIPGSPARVQAVNGL